MLPTLSNYSNNNNTMMVHIGDIDLYFSYRTIVAYEDSVDGIVISKLDWRTGKKWSATTSKHIRWIETGKRVDNFKEMLLVALSRL